MSTSTEKPSVYFHITVPSKIKWKAVTEDQFYDAYLMASQKARNYKNCAIFSCVNPTRKGRRHYISFNGKFFTAVIPHGMQFINIVEQLQSERVF